MSLLLKNGQSVLSNSSRKRWVVKEYLGSGSQGEVYRVLCKRKQAAVKCFTSPYIQTDKRLIDRLERAISLGTPSNRFLWPKEMISFNRGRGIGYLMPLKPQRYYGMVSLMKRKVEPGFRSIVSSGFELADSFLQLHSMGLCYRDISFNNIFFNPKSGEIRICDNDNIDINGQAGLIAGTPRFMAPAIVTGQVNPSTQTDLFSLAVLLFYMLMMHHPLEGKLELDINCMDLPAMRKLYGRDPVFIFDPNNISNRPVRGFHDNAIAFWPLYPSFIKNLFTLSFTEGMHDLESCIRESVWRQAMLQLRDSIILCGNCGNEVFFDFDNNEVCGKKTGYCWACGSKVQEPVKLKMGRNNLVLNYNTKVYPHHIEVERLYDFSKPVASVINHPKKPHIWGLNNLSDKKWQIINAAGIEKTVKPGQSLTLRNGLVIYFGKNEGKIYI